MVEVEFAVPITESVVDEWFIVAGLCNRILGKVRKELILRLENGEKGCIITSCDFSG